MTSWRLIVAGSRTITNRDEVFRALDWLAQNVTVAEIVSGGCRGVDRLGEQWARAQNTPVTVCRFPAQWGTYGRAAGPMRNEEMAKHADALLAIWDGQSRGTNHMINCMRARTKPIFVWRPKPDGSADITCSGVPQP